MDKPEWCSAEVWDRAVKLADEYARWLHAGNSSGILSDHAEHALADSFSRAILSAQSQAYIDAARIAEDWVGGAEYISAAILQRKEEIGR